MSEINNPKKTDKSPIIQASNYRDSIGTAEASGKRKWVYPKKVSGKYKRRRTFVAAILLILLVVFPIIPYVFNTKPIFQFNIIAREFYIFGFYFSPSDLTLFAIGMITGIVFIIVFTVIYGRIFCGWICPQTIFMEMVFRKIEYWIEGDRNKQIRLDKQKWDAEKIRKKGLKWFIFLIISVIITHILLSYIIGLKQVIENIIQGPAKNFALFITICIFTAAFYFVFAWFREQVCTLVCPYGRLQGVLVDANTINVAYNFVRGEGKIGRASWRNKEDRKALGKGDCIDCKQCVEVCPTGIDIRNGSQLECINCTACIDACNHIMKKVNLPTGLILYTSENMIKNQSKFKFTPRIIAYTFVLFILVGILFGMTSFRARIEAKILKITGTEYVRENGYIVDYYTVRIINKNSEKKKIYFEVINLKDVELELSGKKVIDNRYIYIEPTEVVNAAMNIKIRENRIKSYKIPLIIGVYDENKKEVGRTTTNFEGPLKVIF